MQKVIRNSDMVHSNTLTNAFLREERKLDKKIQNLNTEKRLSLTHMDSEIKFYRKMNHHKPEEKWEDNCNMSDISEAGSDFLDTENDSGIMVNDYCYDSNMKSKTRRDRGHNSNVKSLPSRNNSSFIRFTPFGSTRKASSFKEFPRQFHNLCAGQDPREAHSEPPQTRFFSNRLRDVSQYCEGQISQTFTRLRSSSGSQTQKPEHQNEIVNYDRVLNPSSRSMSVKHADFGTGVGTQERGGHLASELTHQMGGRQASGLTHEMGGHQASELTHHHQMSGHQASGLTQQFGGHQACRGFPNRMGGHQANGFTHRMNGHQASGITRGTGNHKSIVHIRDLVHHNHQAGEFTFGMGGHESSGLTPAMYAGHDSQLITSGISQITTVSKSGNLATGTKNLGNSDTLAGWFPDSPPDKKRSLSYKGPNLNPNYIGPSTSPRQQSVLSDNTADWVIQNTTHKHPGISLQNPMLFHPRFNNDTGLIPEENREFIDPNSFHALKNCRYLRIPQQPSHPAIDSVFNT
jgi:hypothetical protein